MKRWERRTFNALSLVVATSGFAYLWMKYFIHTDDPFALVNHPWQSATLQVHVLASPLVMLVFGIILNSHIIKKLRATAGSNRRSGVISLAALTVMVCSGYLLPTATGEAWMKALVVAHVVSGVLFTAAYASHLIISLDLVRRWMRPAIREVA